jgi:hypothetical protein
VRKRCETKFSRSDPSRVPSMEETKSRVDREERRDQGTVAACEDKDPTRCSRTTEEEARFRNDVFPRARASFGSRCKPLAQRQVPCFHNIKTLDLIRFPTDVAEWNIAFQILTSSERIMRTCLNPILVSLRVRFRKESFCTASFIPGSVTLVERNAVGTFQLESLPIVYRVHCGERPCESH